MKVENNKGFTLVELLLTIVLLAIISVISFVSINAVIKKNKENQYNTIINNIKMAVKEYVSDEKYINQDFEDNYFSMTANELYTKNYLSGDIVDPYTKQKIDPNDINIYVYLKEDKTIRTIRITDKDDNELFEGSLTNNTNDVVTSTTTNVNTGTYQISYVLNGGTLSGNAPNRVSYDSVVLISNPTKAVKIIGNENTTEGANGEGVTISNNNIDVHPTFSGWSSNASLGLQGNAKSGKGVTLFDNWNGEATLDTYFVNLRDASGTVSLYANWQDALVKLPKITKSTYFCGWTTDADGHTIQYNSEDNYNLSGEFKRSTLNLYAVCEIAQFTLTASANGGTITSTSGWTGTGSSATKTIIYESTYGTLPTVSRSGYNFDGWYTSASGGTKIETSTNVTTASNHTIYAHWTEIVLPSADITGGTTAKQTSQSFTISCANETGIVGYYWGVNQPTQSTTFTTVASAKRWSGTGSTTSATTYYLGCKDSVGTVVSASVSVNSYTVYNMLLKLNGTKGNYATTNYALDGEAVTYYIKTGTNLNSGSVCSKPTGASTLLGYTLSVPSTTAVSLTSVGTNFTVNANTNIGCWYNRLEYTVGVISGENGKVTVETVTQTGNSASVASGASGTLLVRHGDTVRATASANNGSHFNSWTGGYLSGSANPTVGSSVTSDKTISATWEIDAYGLYNSDETYAGSATTLASAFTNVPAGGIIKALKDDTSSAVATNTKNVTLNTNGYTITLEKSIVNNSGASLTINGNGIVASNADTNVVFNSGTLKTENVTLKNTYSTGAFVIRNHGTYTSDSGTQISATASGGRALGVYDGGTININGGTITANNVTIYDVHQNGTINIKGGTITSTADAAIYIPSSASVSSISISGGSVIGNTGISVSNAVTINVNSGLIRGKEDSGIKLYNSSATLIIGKKNDDILNIPVIVGLNYAVSKGNGITPTIKWYDGLLYGKTATGNYPPNIDDLPTGYEPVTVADTSYTTGGYKSYLIDSSEVVYELQNANGDAIGYADTLIEAFNKVQSGQTIMALVDNTSSASVTNSKSNVTLNTNGKTITLENFITNNTTLLVNGNGKITTNLNTTLFLNFGSLTTENVTLEIPSTKSGTVIKSYREYTSNAGTQIDCTNSSCKAIVLQGGTLNVNGGTITSGSVAISETLEHATINISGGTITSTSGNGIETVNSGYSSMITISGGSIIGTFGVVINNLTTVKVTGGFIMGTHYNGAGIKCTRSDVTLIIGKDDNHVLNSPVIVGANVAISNSSPEIIFKWYDGLLYGKTATGNYYNDPDETPLGYSPVTVADTSYATGGYKSYLSNSFNVATFYYQSSTVAGNTTLASTSASCSGTSCEVTIPDEVLNSVGTWNNAYAGLSTSVGNMTAAVASNASVITISGNTSYYALYSSAVNVYRPSTVSACTNESFNRNQWFVSDTSMATTVLATSASPMVNYTPTILSGYNFSKLTSASASSGSAYTSVASAALSNITTFYTSLSINQSVTFNYYNGTSQASVSGSGSKTLHCANATTTDYANGNVDVPSVVSQSTGANGGTYQGVSNATDSSAIVTPNTGTTSYYAVYSSVNTASFIKSTGVSGLGSTTLSCDSYFTSDGTSYSSDVCSITLPAITDSNGYVSLGWVNSNNNNSLDISNVGSAYTLTGDTNLYTFTVSSSSIDLYMATDGNDVNVGLLNENGKRIATLQRGFDIIKTISDKIASKNIKINMVSINIAAGTYYNQHVGYNYANAALNVGTIRIFGARESGQNLTEFITNNEVSTDAVNSLMDIKFPPNDPPALKIWYLDVKRYTNGFLLRNLNNSDIAYVNFEEIGDYYTGVSNSAVGAIDITYSSNNTIRSCRFDKIRNANNGSYIHVVYVAWQSSDNQIYNNYIKDAQPSPIRIRGGRDGGSNNNKVYNNTFINSGTSPYGYMSEWRNDEEQASTGNEFYGNDLQGGFGGVNLYPIVAGHNGNNAITAYDNTCSSYQSSCD